MREGEHLEFVEAEERALGHELEGIVVELELGEVGQRPERAVVQRLDAVALEAQLLQAAQLLEGQRVDLPQLVAVHLAVEKRDVVVSLLTMLGVGDDGGWLVGNGLINGFRILIHHPTW